MIVIILMNEKLYNFFVLSYTVVR